MPKKIDSSSYFKIKNKWNKNRNVSLFLDGKLSEVECKNIALFLFKKPKDAFAKTLLDEILEEDNFPIWLMEKAYKFGDVACKVSICLRRDIPKKLVLKCLSSRIKDVREHAALIHQKPKRLKNHVR